MGSLPEGEPLSRGGSEVSIFANHAPSILHTMHEASAMHTPMQNVLLGNHARHTILNSAASATRTVHEAAALCDAQLVEATQRLAGLLDAVCSPGGSSGVAFLDDGCRAMQRNGMVVVHGGVEEEAGAGEEEEDGEEEAVHAGMASSPEQLSEVRGS